jgi:origin recognition complex subunit 2
MEDLTPKAAEEHRVPDAPPDFNRWLAKLRLGFTLLVHGCGSKRNVLDAFAAEKLVPWGAIVVKMEGYVGRFPTAECLRDVLAQVHPNAPPVSKASVDAAVSSLSAARSHEAEASKSLRPLCLVVHNLEQLPVPHQAALASLAAKAARLYIVASVDSIWAHLAWSPSVSRDFNFCHLRVHTHELYEAEAAARYTGGLPAWADPVADKRRGPKVAFALVLRSLTNNHGELVQVIAEHQLEKGGRTGISMPALLTITSERMIAKQLPKLRGLLTELKDHEIVVERNNGEGDVLYQLPCDDKWLRRLADGPPFNDDGSADEDSEDGEPV